MKNICITKGVSLYDFFVIPTIRYSYNGFNKFLTIEWLKWFVGVKWE